MDSGLPFSRNGLSNRVFEGGDAILEDASDAKLQTQRIARDPLAGPHQVVRFEC